MKSLKKTLRRPQRLCVVCVAQAKETFLHGTPWLLFKLRACYELFIDKRVYYSRLVQTRGQRVRYKNYDSRERVRVFFLSSKERSTGRHRGIWLPLYGDEVLQVKAH